MHYIHRKHQNARNLTIKIDDEGTVVVTSPRWISEKKVAQFLEEKKNWVENALAQVQTKKKHLDPKKEIMIFGKKYAKKITTQTHLPLGIKLQDNEFTINQLHPEETPYTTQKVHRFLKSTAEKYLFPRTHQIGKHMKIDFGRITLREQKTRWGSCSNHGNLNFNWRLVHHPTPVIDYVIVHELAHRVHLDHSTQFWKLVEKFHPEYRIHQGWLKRRGKVW